MRTLRPAVTILPLLVLFVLVGALAFLKQGSGPAESAFPGVNGKIAFDTDRDANSEVYTMNADGTGQTNVTNNAAEDGYPAWSPFGDAIAFESDRDANGEVYTMNADGTGQINRSNNAAGDGSPAWSPNGSKLAFASDRDANAEVYTMNADGTGQTNVTNNAAWDDSPAWSPHADAIAFKSDRDANGEVYWMHDFGGNQMNHTENAANDSAPAWSPDGKKIAFTSIRGGLWQIYVMDFDGSDQTNISNSVAHDIDPAWSPDGSKIAFGRHTGGNWEIFVMNADGTGQTNVSNNPADDWRPDWQPQVITVNSTGDQGDNNAGDGTCATVGAVCTLRAAIEEANALAGTDTINFNIAGAGPHTISPGSALPNISDPVIINGTSEPDYQWPTNAVQLDGSSAGVGVNGLTITAGNSTVRALTVSAFTDDGIELSTSGGNTIERNDIQANGGHGVLISGNGNLVGSRTILRQIHLYVPPPPPGRNTIALNGGDGVFVASGSGNSILGNNIYDNVGLGIDIAPDGQDLGMDQAGLLSALWLATGWTNVNGYIWGGGGHANETVYIEAFLNDACDPAPPAPGFGEGKDWQRAGEFVTDTPSGDLSASGTFQSPTSNVGKYITATKTLADGTTSEFTNCVQVLNDGDGDGIQDMIDGYMSGPTFVSQANTPSDKFTDKHLGGTSYGDFYPGAGSYPGRNGCLVSAVDLSPGGGVVGATCTPPNWGPAKVNLCGFDYDFPHGTSLMGKCGSADQEVGYGPITVDLGTMSAILPSATSSTIDDLGGGSYQVSNDAGSANSITAGGLEVLPGQTVTVSDADSDTLTWQVDNCPSWYNPGQGWPPWTVPSGDDDCDGWTSADETAIGTDPDVACSGDNWPPDIAPVVRDDFVDISDINELRPPVFFSTLAGGPPYDTRLDIARDAGNIIDISDINKLRPPLFFAGCTP